MQPLIESDAGRRSCGAQPTDISALLYQRKLGDDRGTVGGRHDWHRADVIQGGADACLEKRFSTTLLLFSSHAHHGWRPPKGDCHATTDCV